MPLTPTIRRPVELAVYERDEALLWMMDEEVVELRIPWLRDDVGGMIEEAEDRDG